MVSIIAGALIETLTKYMFQKALNEMDKVEIGGAPSWYMKEVDDQMCVFSFKEGDYSSIEIAKADSKYKITKKIDNLLEIVVYDNYKNISSNKEKAIVQFWKKDENLPTFVSKNINYSRVAYEDEIKTSFVRSCIAKNIVLDYQKERLSVIEDEVLKYKKDKAFSELGNENFMSDDSKDKVFNELSNEIKKHSKEISK